MKPVDVKSEDEGNSNPDVGGGEERGKVRAEMEQMQLRGLSTLLGRSHC